MTPSDVRAQLVEALRVDLVGPCPGSSLESEVLSQAPSRWYLTGFLVPLEAGEAQRSDETADDALDQPGDADGTDDATAPEPPAARRAFYPSSMGLSLLVDGTTDALTAVVRWGDYTPVGTRNAGTDRAGDAAPIELTVPPEIADPQTRTRPGIAVVATPEDHPPVSWRRTPREVEVPIPLPAQTDHTREFAVPGSGGLALSLTVRPVHASRFGDGVLPDGTRSVSLFLVNRRHPAPDELRDLGFVFQPELEIRSDGPLVARPDVHGLETDDWDERVADLQYRDVCEYAVGHGVSAHVRLDPDGRCRAVSTCWIPTAEVERVAPAVIDGVELGMEALARLVDGPDARARLEPFVGQYRQWIEQQRRAVPTSPPRRREIAEELLKRASVAADRIEAGIALLDDPKVLEAFRVANRVMARSSRQRSGPMRGLDPASVDPPRWRPFQLAFILMNLKGIAEPTHYDRGVVDLLFFPTGGGKTEAYLGLSAFTLVLRRLRHPGIASAGLSVLMRYTLRLLTLDQLSRAATLICALELERQQNADLGDWPFEIGLWVGRAATPNRMGSKGDNEPHTARAKTMAFQRDDRNPSPIPLEDCPWCGTKFKPASFQLRPNTNHPIDLHVHCARRGCEFSGDRHLPILGVDEPIYRRLPCFLIATVDKFAAMPWTGEVGAFFGRVDRHDKDGFFGPCTPDRGHPLPTPALPPPDLVIQDELHLISGPMGTMVGLYESALDELCSRADGDGTIRPKIVASTATVRRAESQIRALFDRRVVDVFPPPGPDRRDSFFAEVHATDRSPARLYAGIVAQGRSLKVVLLRTYLALLGAAQKAYEACGGDKNRQNPADPYMTLVGYFNSLRELGGSRRIIEDEVSTRLTGYKSRRRSGEEEGLFADRAIAYDVLELTSRVGTNKVAEAKRRLGLPSHDKDRVDIAIATNMISVGLDIARLGLMVVLGQPKTSAEYIQATSRVGRDATRPGLVVTLLNVHRPRDRSHYERFAVYHESFYRNVEATSVTPFSPRALDRGLAGSLVGLARLGHRALTPPRGATEILQEMARLDFVAETLSERARTTCDPNATPEAAEELRQRVRLRSLDLLDEWNKIAHDYREQGVVLQYQAEAGAAQRLLRPFLDPELKRLPPRHQKFRANRSMRDVEPSVNLWVKTLDDVEIESEEDAR